MARPSGPAGTLPVAVGSGAVLLPDVKAIPRGLPEIAVAALPAGQRLQDGRSRRLVAAATALPPALRTRVERLREVPGAGVVGYLRDGPRVLLGAPTRLEVKWITAAAILADPASRGAAYVDVRVPERPVAGGLAPRPQAASATTTPGSSSPLGPSSP